MEYLHSQDTNTPTLEKDAVQYGTQEIHVTPEYMRYNVNKIKCAVNTKHILDFKDLAWKRVKHFINDSYILLQNAGYFGYTRIIKNIDEVNFTCLFLLCLM